MSMNTHSKGVLHFVIFKEVGEKEFTGICYELSLVLTGTDEAKLQKELTETAKNYAQTIMKKKLSLKLLNQQKKLPKHYRNLFKMFEVDKRFTSKDTINHAVEAKAFISMSPAPMGV